MLEDDDELGFELEDEFGFELDELLVFELDETGTFWLDEEVSGARFDETFCCEVLSGLEWYVFPPSLFDATWLVADCPG